MNATVFSCFTLLVSFCEAGGHTIRIFKQFCLDQDHVDANKMRRKRNKRVKQKRETRWETILKEMIIHFGVLLFHFHLGVGRRATQNGRCGNAECEKVCDPMHSDVFSISLFYSFLALVCVCVYILLSDMANGEVKKKNNGRRKQNGIERPTNTRVDDSERSKKNSSSSNSGCSSQWPNTMNQKEK